METDMSTFAQVAAEVSTAGRNNPTFVVVAAKVQEAMERHFRTAVTDRDAEWQRVHSYIADVLKDAHVLYAKLARLEGDFTGVERHGLEQISGQVLRIGEDLSKFSKEFYEGKFSPQEKGFSYGRPVGLNPEEEEHGEEEHEGGEGEGEGHEGPEPEGAEIPVIIEGEMEEE